MSIAVRPARSDDRPTLVRFMGALQDVERALHPDSRLPGADMAEAHTAYLLEEAETPGGLVLLAEEPETGRAVGFLIAYEEAQEGIYLTPPFERIGWVSDLYVEEAARGGGATDALLAAAEAHFRARGITRLLLSYLVGNEAAARAYAKRGFAPYETVLAKPID
ncbi:MAG: GNAT family N-acetyltransferase [Marivibrio sp.]|uniref:GNAT family N-acetyltransferase n=1 Tax=Marivibrio sp. TaxID=2039719 RepID=UPI0032EED65D